MTIRLNNQTWYSILELAEDYGWNPLGTVLPGVFELARLFSGDPSEWYGDYWSSGERLVLLEDALNMGDALQEAYLDYEPIRLPTLHAFSVSWNGGFEILNRPQPGIGIVQLMADFCKFGAYTIEKY